MKNKLKNFFTAFFKSHKICLISFTEIYFIIIFYFIKRNIFHYNFLLYQEKYISL
uniref:Uncharacterized protein n=1 Tax=viral metagenome TaxID=1070528 RepID=A0A6C0AEI4_9ZZZZ